MGARAAWAAHVGILQRRRLCWRRKATNRGSLSWFIKAIFVCSVIFSVNNNAKDAWGALVLQNHRITNYFNFYTKFSASSVCDFENVYSPNHKQILVFSYS
jgi:hypothetical protein